MQLDPSKRHINKSKSLWEPPSRLNITWGDYICTISPWSGREATEKSMVMTAGVQK